MINGMREGKAEVTRIMKKKRDMINTKHKNRTDSPESTMHSA